MLNIFSLSQKNSDNLNNFTFVDLLWCCCHPVLRKVGRSVETDLFVAKLFSWQASPTKREHTKLEGKHPHSWKIFSFHKKVLHFMGALKKSEKWDQSTDTRLVFSPKKNPYIYDGSADKEKEKRNMSSESWQLVDLQLSTNFPELSFRPASALASHH